MLSREPSLLLLIFVFRLIIRWAGWYMLIGLGRKLLNALAPFWKKKIMNSIPSMNSIPFDFFKIDFKPRKVNLSSTFPARAKCPKCKDDCYYYWYHMPSYFSDPSSSFLIFNWFKKYINKMNSDWYLDTEPRQNHNISHFNFVWSDKSFKPRLFHTKGVSNNNKMEFI